MTKKSTYARFGIAAGVLLAIAGATTAASAAAGWSYTGPTGPSHWASIDASYAKCADGSAQSPINLTSSVKRPLTNLGFGYVAGEAGIFNNGHTVEAEPLGTNTSTVTIDNKAYSFLQVHFHAPSEHEVNGLHYPVEVHFVNKATDGSLAVVGVFIKRGKANEDWQPFIEKMLTATANAEDTKVELDWAKLLPSNPITLRYNGSLTTPGCAEGVKWNVMTTPIEMSDAQIATFLEAYSGNNRPVQPLHGRVVQLDSTVNK
ncbi:MAG: carbonic anhydrase family protein [Actinomycetales bacterium]|nr:carbonic anhydrase family protein [Actinomycetales bacterium]